MVVRKLTFKTMCLQYQRLSHPHITLSLVITLTTCLVLPSLFSYSYSLTHTGWQTVSADNFKMFEHLGVRCQHHTAIIMFKILNVEGPKYVTEVFTLIRDGVVYNLTKCDNNLVLQKHNTEYLKRSFPYRFCQIVNGSLTP